MRPPFTPPRSARCLGPVLTLLITLAGCGGEPEAPETAAPPEPGEPAEFAGAPYPLSTCPVSGGPLDAMGGSISYVHEGRQIRFCCAGCDKEFEKDPARYLAEIDAKIVAQQKPRYPLERCPVTGRPLDAMAGPIDHVWHNRLVRFCTTACPERFEEDPARYLAALDRGRIEDAPPKAMP